MIMATFPDLAKLKEIAQAINEHIQSEATE